TVAPGGTCTVAVQFSPQALGPRTGNLSIASNAPGSPLVIPLSGSGTEGKNINKDNKDNKEAKDHKEVKEDVGDKGHIIEKFPTFKANGRHAAGTQVGNVGRENATRRALIRPEERPPVGRQALGKPDERPQ